MIRNRYNQVPHLTQDTNEKVANSQLDTTNESQEVCPFPAGAYVTTRHKATYIHIRNKGDVAIPSSQSQNYFIFSGTHCIQLDIQHILYIYNIVAYFRI